jgi:1,2-diacylglycerol 3-alpha-glucosyltransferase
VQRVVPFVTEEAVETVGMRLTRRAAQFANRCDCVIAPSASLGQVLETWGVQTPIEVIPNGIELSRFHTHARCDDEAAFEYSNTSAQLKKSTKNAFGTAHTPESDHAPTAVYLGRLAPEKNVEGLFHAFALSRRSVPDARLCLIGDGPSEPDLQQLAQSLGLQECVTFKGALPYDEVPRALAQCDFFASASSSEVHPLTFIEAMAVGLPCVGTSSPGIVDTVVDGRNGWLADDKPELFSQALTQAFSDTAERRRRAARALEDSRGYAIETTVKRVLEIYQSVLVARGDTTPYTSDSTNRDNNLRAVS